MFELFFILTLAQFQVRIYGKKPMCRQKFWRNLQSDTSHPLQTHLKGIVSCEIRYLNEPSLSRNVKRRRRKGRKIKSDFLFSDDKKTFNSQLNETTMRKSERHLLRVLRCSFRRSFFLFFSRPILRPRTNNHLRTHSRDVTSG